jgi:hypothetical protein
VFAIALFKIFADQIRKKSFEGLLRFLKFDPDEVRPRCFSSVFV